MNNTVVKGHRNRLLRDRGEIKRNKERELIVDADTVELGH